MTRKKSQKSRSAELTALLEQLKQAEVAGRANKMAMSQHEADNKLEFFDRPNPIQADLLEAWMDPVYKVFTFTGGNRIGKTTILTIISLSVMFGMYLWDHRRFPFPHSKPRKIRYVGQDWEKHIARVAVPALHEWWPKKREVKIKKNNNGVEFFWTDVKTGSTLEIMSNNQESRLHEGWHGDLVVYDEPPKREVRIANARGLIDRGGRELFCATLLGEAWLHQEVINARDAKGRPDMTVFNVTGDIGVNVGYGIKQEDVDQFAKMLSEDEKEARLMGKPSYLSGLICKKFNRRTNLRDRFQVPLDWIVDIGVDIHPRKEQAILFCATDDKNQRWLVDEIWGHGNGTWVGEQIMRKVNKNHYRVGKIVCDPLAKGDSNNEFTTFDKIDMVLNRYGYVLDTATKDKDSGILEINNHLLGPNNEPSLFVFNDLVRTIFEFESWMWDDETQKAQKKNDDMMENLYRILLESTQWYPMEDEDEQDSGGVDDTNSWTGY